MGSCAEDREGLAGRPADGNIARNKIKLSAAGILSENRTLMGVCARPRAVVWEALSVLFVPNVYCFVKHPPAFPELWSFVRR